VAPRHPHEPEPRRRPRGRTVPALVAAGAWLAACAAGLLALSEYAATPGPPAATKVAWPEFAPLELAQDRPTLLVFLHPRCPCSTATLAELSRALAAAGTAPAVRFVYTVPENAGEAWAHGDLWRLADRYDHASRVLDPGGALARAFGAAVSGACALYSPAGRLLYAGGITGARAHEGDNAGKSALLRALERGREPLHVPERHPVFGCPLVGSDADPARAAPREGASS